MNTRPADLGYDKAEVMRRLCALAGIDLMEMQRCLMAYQTECGQLRNRCCEMEAKYSTLEDLLRGANCPSNVLFSDFSMAEYSADNQVALKNLVTGLGGDFVDALPVPPGKMIRLEHGARPGYRPAVIALDLSLANNGINYLDVEIEFFIVTGSGMGKSYGPKYRGNQFLEKNGTQIRQKWPQHQAKPLTVGGMERLAVEIRHTGNQNNIDSIFLTVSHDANCAYLACANPKAV